MRKLTIIALILSLTSCLKEDDLKKDYAGFNPVNIGDGWIVGSSKENNVDSSQLNSVYESVYADDDTWPLKSMLVFRNGQLIAESYMKDDADRTRPQAIWSCTKQIMGLLAGILWDQNEIFKVDRLEQFLEKYLSGHRDKQNITIEDLLTMRSGIGFDNDEHSDVLRKKEESNSIDFVLGLNLNYTPGSHFNYNDGDPQLMSAIIQSLKYKQADVFAEEALFSKIGLSNYTWHRYIDGISLGGFGIMTTPREIAKVGQLVLNKGMWDSTQVVSEEWIADMLSVHSSVRQYSNIDFGYYWWIYSSKGYYFMWGNGGQYVFLIPDKQAMVVFTSIEQLAYEFTVQPEKASTIVDRIVDLLRR